MGTISIGGGITIKEATVILGAAEIVGTGAGTLGHANGVILVPAVAGKRIAVHQVMLRYNHDTAAYTGGGNSFLMYGPSLTHVVVGPIPAAFFTSATDSWRVMTVMEDSLTGSGDSSAEGINEALAIASLAAFTQPGTAAGTLKVTVYYSEVSD